MNPVKFFLICFFFAPCIFSQEDSVLQDIGRKFETFQYDSVISTADSLLFYSDSLSNDTRLEIYRMKGISHFSLDQNNRAENSFNEILKIDSSFSFDSAKTSPKIISFFNEVRNDFKRMEAERDSAGSIIDTVFVTKVLPDPEAISRIKISFFKSILLPGLGHLHLENSFKGWFLTSLSVASLASSVYFFIDTDSKKNKYLNEANIYQVNAKYNEYNSSYKKRNYSIIAFAAVWLYSQIDLLLFSDSINYAEEAVPAISFNSAYGFQIKYRVAF